MIFNQETIRCWTVMKLGLIPIEVGTRSSVIKIYFKVEKCGRCKLESNHHSSAHYLSLTDPVENYSCHPSLRTKPRSTPMISTLTFHWTGHSTTHHMVILKNKGGLKKWTNYPTYVAPPCQKLNNFIRWKWQTLWWLHTYAYGSPKNPTLNPYIRGICKLPAQL